jgi:pimeloyl-ACP methyl ester carboxylesterase
MVLDTMRLVAADARGGVFAGCGHYMPEEAPCAVAEQIIRFMGK